MKTSLRFLTLFVFLFLAAGEGPAAEQGLLVLKPGVTTRGEHPQTWQLDLTSLSAEAAVEGASKLSARLYGESEVKLHAPLVIKARFDREKVFGFKVNAVSLAGGTLTVKLNGTVVFRKTWPAAKATHRVGALWQFPLPAGPAEIALEVSRGPVVMEAYYVADSAGQLPAGAEKADVDTAPPPPAKAVTKPPLPALSGTVAGYRGIWFTLGQFLKHGDKYSGGLGTYTANHNPIAVYSPEADKTFFTYGGTTAKDERRLLVMASCFDHKTGRVPRPVIVHDKLGVDDPHDNGSIQLDDKGHVWVFVSGRGRKRPGFKYRSKEPFSVTAFERVCEEEMTYPQPWFIAGRGWLHLFTKYTKGRELYWETSADGRTWSDDRKLAGLGGHYQVSGVRDGKVASFFNYHPGGVPDKRTNLYYVQTDDFGQTWTTADGRTLETPLSEVKNPALVIDYAAQGRLQYTCDLNFDREGRPMLLYVISPGHEPGPENDPREVRLTRWDGRAWQTGTITRTDHNYDMGSLWVCGDEWKVIFPTLPGPQPYGGGGEMCLWASSDQGKTWTLKKQITRDSPLNHNYVRRPRNARDPFFAFWADGNPAKFSESRLYFCDSTGEHVWQLPYDMEGDSAAPTEIRK
jgi:hypothetical protein